MEIIKGNNQYDSKLMFQVKSFDINDFLNVEDTAPEKQEHYSILYIEKGKGTHVIDYKTYGISDGAIHFLVPNQVHILKPEGFFKGKQITFTKEFLIYNNFPSHFLSQFHFFKPYGEKPPLRLCNNSMLKLSVIMSRMDDYQSYQQRHTLIALGALFKLFLIECNNSSFSNISVKAPKQTNDSIFHSFCELLENNYRSNHKVKYYSTLINVSPKHLSSIVRKKTGLVAKQYIQNKILSESKKLLLHTEMSIKEISYHVGFNEPLHYSSFFKRRSGISPSQYRGEYFS